MKAVILAGGLGTRLREETEFRPKPMVEVGGKPILWHIMKIFASHGVREFVVCVGYRGQMIKEYFLNYAAHNSDFTIDLARSGTLTFHDDHLESEWQVTVADTGLHTQTGGRIKLVERYLADEERFLVTYGDGVADVDIQALMRHHEAHGRLATVTTVRPPTRFGRVELGADDLVTRFLEKPVDEDWVSAGFFVFERAVLDRLDESSVLEQAPLASLAADGELAAYRHDGFFQPMDTYREASLLNAAWDEGSAPWKTWKD